MKNKAAIPIIIVPIFLFAILVQFNPAFYPAKDGMRMVVLEGNKIVRTQDFPKGQFCFFITRQGVFYNNTSEGSMWNLTHPRQICAEHFAIVKKNISEMAKKWG